MLLTGTLLILFYQTVRCDFSCGDGHYMHPTGCGRCFYTCHWCNNEQICTKCISAECSLCSSTCNSSSCGLQRSCTYCLDGFYLKYSSNGNYCKRCYYIGCKCSREKNCQSCLPGRCGYNCQSCCNSNCTECLAGSNTCANCVAGRFGTNCEFQCPVNCKHNLCSRDNGLCADGCNPGWFGSTCQFRCPANCSECEHSSNCKVCNSGYYLTEEETCHECPIRCSTCFSANDCVACRALQYWGNVCQHECTNCLQGCERTRGCTGQCEHGYYKVNSDKGGYECIRCPGNCLRCTNGTACTQCESKYWGNKCQFACNIHCLWQECFFATGICKYGCVDGYFGERCTDHCPTECQSCSSDSACDECQNWYYKYSIYYQKCECSIDMCSKYSANKCEDCKTSGWFPKYTGCCPCHSGCKSGECFSNGTCLECNNGQYGIYCHQTCSKTCLASICYRDGSCPLCADGYYGRVCDKNCSDLNVRCKQCLQQDGASAICTKCENGFYPQLTSCKVCNKNCDDTYSPFCNSSSGKCNNGCKPGWFGDYCNTSCGVTNCQKCARNDANICNSCMTGFYLTSNGSCSRCPANCQSVCNTYNGSCTEGCVNGWSGNQCDIPCAHGCMLCDQLYYNSCRICKTGYFGESCELNCSTGCISVNESQVCTQTNGSCIVGCKDSFWGDACESRCGTGCNENICNRTTGVCLNDCKISHYGLRCDNPCSDNCAKNNGRTCDEGSGYCTIGCKRGWYGQKCGMLCSEHCKSNVCYRNNGSCTSGCTNGYTGAACTEALLSDESDISVVAIGGGAGGGVAVLIILSIVIGVVIVRRRRNSSKLDTHDTVGTHTPQKIASTDIGPVYSNINDSGIENADGGPNAVTNQLYANTVVRMSDISGNEQVGNATLARPGSENYLTEEEMVDGEKIDVEQSETSGVPDNTYYNLGGKRVQVEKLADYVKHTCTKDINQEFHEIPKGLLKGYKEAKKAKNAAKNKYKLIYPYDETRVILCDGGNDYMNASYIDGHTRQKEYIASSGPFKKSCDTTNDFWRMILQEKCETLVMLTNLSENKEVKCEKYWPDVGQSCNYGNIHVTCVTEDIYADFTIRTLAATKKNEKFNVCHLHFTAWPDKGVPHDVTSMIEFRQKVRSLHKDKTCPIIVHCSAGIGRTGTFIALDLMTNEGEDRGSVDIFGSVFNLRYQRCNMVQTPDQYVYLHHALLHSLTFDCHSIPGDTFLQNYNKLLEKNGGQRIIDNQYQQLQSVAEELTDDDRTEIDRNKAFVKKNRIGADVPVDVNRVKLKENRKPEDSDYINAVYINSFRKHQKFIVAQTPLPSTVVDFLTLIYQEKCSCVVSMEEANMKDKTVKVYWPADNQIVKHGVFQVSCKESKTEKNYIMKKLSLTYHGPKGMETHDVNLFIFTNWREGAPVPSSSDSLLDLVKTVDVMNYKTETNSPILIHCRTGADRSCLYCAVSILIEKMEIEHEVSVVNTLRQIKARRMSAIPSIDQYKFCYQAVITYLQSFDTYSNFS